MPEWVSSGQLIFFTHALSLNSDKSLPLPAQLEQVERDEVHGLMCALDPADLRLTHVGSLGSRSTASRLSSCRPTRHMSLRWSLTSSVRPTRHTWGRRARRAVRWRAGYCRWRAHV